MKHYIMTAIPLMLAGSLAHAQEVTLDFEGLQDSEQVEAFYGGGTGSAGSSGADYGVTFTSAAHALIDSDAGGSGSIANEPSPDTVIYPASSQSFVMNVPAGFTSEFAFYYSSNPTGSVTLYDELDATGAPIATIPVQTQYNQSCTGDPNGDFCNWTLAETTFAGTARSVQFDFASSGSTGIDNISFVITDQTAHPIPTLSPLPILMASTLLAVIGLRRQYS